MAAFGDYNGDNKSQRDIDFDSGYIAGKQSCQAEIESLKTQIRALIANSPQVPGTVPRAEYDKLLDLLERAQNGLKWYQDAHPEHASESDGELHAEIDAIAKAEGKE